MTVNTTSGAASGPAAPTDSAAVSLRPLAQGAVRITGGLWHQRAEANRLSSIPQGLERLHSAGNIRNLEIAAGTVEGEAEGPVFADSDVYKWLEAAAWEYARSGDEDLLESQLELTRTVARAQAADGYIDSVVQIREGERYRDLPWSHEHYCMGHLIQAGVAQVRATGSRELLDVAVKAADHLVNTFGEDKRHDVDGHPVIETALVELYRETGTPEYLTLAKYFVDARGHGLMASYGKEPTYFSDRVPVRKATTVEGHAVRAVYLAAGAADVAVETGDQDLLQALEIQYASMERSKQYVTGGLGSRWEGESFGDPYELPTDRGYAETCAAIGGVQLAWRMLLATGNPGYADQMERMLLNGFLAGVSLTGTEYFYVNPLQLRSDATPEENRSPAHGRRGWFDCACCPPNIMRTLSSLDAYLVTEAAGVAEVPTVQIHQYAASTVQAAGLTLTVDTEYPWNGEIRVRVEAAPAGAAAIEFRVPAWARGATLEGRNVDPGTYARVERTWRSGDEVLFRLPMETRLTAADPRVDAVRGCVAIERGPLVYALEQEDQPAPVDDLYLLPASSITAQHHPDLLGGVTVLSARGAAGNPPAAQARSPYAPLEETAPGGRAPLAREDLQLTAIPYYAWANRGPQPMRVWTPVQ